jgi:peroxiredoxin
LSIAATMRGCLNAARRTRCAEKTVIDRHSVPAAALSQCSKKRLPQLIDRESRFECQRLSL